MKKRSRSMSLPTIVVISVLVLIVYSCVINKGMFSFLGSKVNDTPDGSYLVVADWCGYSKKYMNQLQNSTWQPDYVVKENTPQFKKFKNHIKGFPSVINIKQGQVELVDNPWGMMKETSY